MLLNNFGGVLSFALELEDQSRQFYEQIGQNQECSDLMSYMNQFDKDSQKNTKLLKLTRQENVTEMILEAINDFTRAPFLLNINGMSVSDRSTMLSIAKKIEETCESYYRQAAEKMRGLPEVAQSLKTAEKRRTAHRQALNEF